MCSNPLQVSEYVSRINRVLDFVENHLDEPLNLVQLSQVAGFSAYHFHRIFAAMLGETLFSFIGRLRMEKAARLLSALANITVTEAALACGFSSPAAFSRAFRAYFKVSPSDFIRRYRKSNTGKADSMLYQALRNAGNATHFRLSYDEFIENTAHRRENMKSLQGEVKVEDFAETALAYVRHIGPYAGDGALFGRLFEKLFAWAVPRGLADMANPAGRKEIIIYHDVPGITEPEKLRISAGLVVPAGTPVSGEVGLLAIPAGRYAVGRFVISDQEYGEAWQYVCGVWLPGSGYEPADGYSFELYEHGQEPETAGKCAVAICVPVKPM